MAKFCGTITVTIEIAVQVEDITAKDEEAATAKLQKMIDDGKFSLNWQTPDKASGEWEEQSQEAEIDSVEEQ